MSSDEPHEQPESSAPKGSPAPDSGRDRPRFRSRRPRFRRGNRGGTGRSGGESRPESRSAGSAASEPRADRPPGSIQDAIAHARHIQSELEGVLEEINEILRILDQAEREKHASEEEIDNLRDALDKIHHRSRGPSRPAREPLPRSSAAERPVESEPEESEDAKADE